MLSPQNPHPAMLTTCSRSSLAGQPESHRRSTGNSRTNCRSAGIAPPPASSCSASSFAEETATQTQLTIDSHRHMLRSQLPLIFEELCYLGMFFLWGKPYRNVIVTPATTSDCITNRSLLSSFSLRRKSQRASDGLWCGHKRNNGSKGDFPKTSSLVSLCKGQSRKEKPSGDPGLVTNLKPLTAQSCMVSVLPCSLRAASKPETSRQPFSCIFHSLATGYFSSSRGPSGFCRPSIPFSCPETLLSMWPWLDVHIAPAAPPASG